MGHLHCTNCQSSRETIWRLDSLHCISESGSARHVQVSVPCHLGLAPCRLWTEWLVSYWRPSLNVMIGPAVELCCRSLWRMNSARNITRSQSSYVAHLILLHFKRRQSTWYSNTIERTYLQSCRRKVGLVIWMRLQIQVQNWHVCYRISSSQCFWQTLSP